MDTAPDTDVPGYELGAVLGAGASGRVWSARRRHDGMRCAVKVVAPLDGDLEQAVREAAVLERVRHEHVLRLHDVVPLAGDAGATDRLALVLELADGGSLAQVVTARGHLTAGEVVTVLSPLAGALADLHAAGLTHGDLSPGNVLFSLDGKPKLSDLGVCRLAGETGTDAYGVDGFVAPELLDGVPVSPASDVFGVGALAWYCLTGTPPEPVFLREPLEALAPHAPAELVEVVDACLAVDATGRPEAMEVSLAMFDAAPAEPVALAGGDDPALGLTHRIRAEAATAGDEAAAPRGRSGAHRSRAGAARGGPGSHRSGASGWAAHRRPLLLGAVAIAVLAAVLVPTAPMLGSWWQDRGTAGQPVGEAGAATTGDADTGDADPGDADPGDAPTGSRPTSEGTGDLDPDRDQPGLLRSSPAATTRPPAVLQALATRRADAWTSGEVTDLSAAHARGSPAMDRDAADLQLAAEQGVDYADLAFTVRRAEVVYATEEVVRLEAVLDRSAYRLLGEQPQQRPAARGEPVVVELHWTDEGWRIAEWS